MRLSEMTDQQLIKQIDDDAVAREVGRRLVTARVKVSDREDALMVRCDRLQRDLDKAVYELQA